MSSTVIPALRYRDAPRMIEWLCAVFGFARHAVHEDGQGGIRHAQLTLGPGMVMLGSMRVDELDRLESAPPSVAGSTQGPYLVVSDADEVYKRARTAGAEIVVEIKDEDYGGRGFSCRDPEGFLWNVGTYDPWQTSSR